MGVRRDRSFEIASGQELYLGSERLLVSEGGTTTEKLFRTLASRDCLTFLEFKFRLQLPRQPHHQCKTSSITFLEFKWNLFVFEHSSIMVRKDTRVETSAVSR